MEKPQSVVMVKLPLHFNFWFQKLRIKLNSSKNHFETYFLNYRRYVKGGEA